jgi:hypothetical protein
LTLVLTPVLLAAPMVASRRFGWLWRQIRGAPPAPVVKPYDIPRAAE